jgi:hypothetical protein
MIKNYLNDLICACAEETFGQDAVEFAILSNQVSVTGVLDADVKAIMSQYDSIVEAYHSELSRQEAEKAAMFGQFNDPSIGGWGSDNDDRDREISEAA